jgi:phosphoribosylformylglycinamidine synthase
VNHSSFLQSVAQAFPDIDRQRAADVRVLVLTGYGFNCEAETSMAFAALGADVEQVHLSELVERPFEILRDRHFLAFIGGFSFGDHVAGGRVAANRLRFRAGEALAKFVDDGGLSIGMCNGFQVMTKLGLLPALGRKSGSGLAPQQVSLAANARLGYRDAWVRLRANAASPCVFTRGLDVLEAPSRHGEGRLVYADAEVEAEIERLNLVALRYVNEAGEPTQEWPANPNGSARGAAGICDLSGRIFGLMPHPEAYLYAENHPRWIEQRDEGKLPSVGQGLSIFANGIRHCLAQR